MFGFLIALGVGAALLIAASSKPKAKAASSLPIPHGAAPAGLPGVGVFQTTALQVPESKNQYWITKWPVASDGFQFVLAQSVNNPQGDWVSFYANPKNGARKFVATNPPPRTQARLDFKF